MNINDAFPSNYLKASDLGGSEPVVTIDRVEYEAVGRNKEIKAVVYFNGKKKGVVLNKTNATKIASLTGSTETDDWAGCRVRLYATETEFGGETVECIRVKAAEVKTVKPAVSTNGSKTTKARTKQMPAPVEEADSEFVDDAREEDEVGF